MFQTTPKRSGSYLHIYSRDAALDIEREDFDHEKWIDLGDEKYLPTLDGRTATEFVMRHLTDEELCFVQGRARAEGEEMMLWWAVALSLVRIEPYVEGREVTRVPGKFGRTYASDDDMAIVRGVDDQALFVELGLRAIKEAQGDPT